MLYNKFQDTSLSALGLGCMRFPVIDGQSTQVDMAAVKEMVACAMARGVNYYDTAWGYHGGFSEPVMGEILQDYPRESYHLATKFPGYDLSNMDKVAEIFEAQLERCRTDYFDFYLLHNVCEMNIDGYLSPEFGIVPYLVEQKKQGRIRHLGFSTHATIPVLEQFLAAFGADMEFCQIQLNWVDWTFQDAKARVDLLNRHNLPIWVMEPVRGGMLAKLPAQHEATLRQLQPERSMPEWAFRFLQNVPGVTMVLSGMSTLEQIQENAETFSAHVALPPSEMEALHSIAGEIIPKNALPCTACNYCTTYCPQQLKIPWFIGFYNEALYAGDSALTPRTMQTLSEEEKPGACLGCRACEAVCPQGIKISEMMANYAEKLRRLG